MGYEGICVIIGIILDLFLLFMTDMKLGRLVGGLSLVMLVIPSAFWGLWVLSAGVLLNNCWGTWYVFCDKLIRKDAIV